MAQKLCPRCKNLIPQGLDYCETCKAIVLSEREKIRDEIAKKKARAYNSTRPERYRVFYRSKDWKVTSRAKLQSVEYRCEAGLPGCTHLATETHHIKPIQTEEGWNKRLDWDNLEAVCTSCHNGRHPEKLKRTQEPGVIDIKTLKR